VDQHSRGYEPLWGKVPYQTLRRTGTHGEAKDNDNRLSLDPSMFDRLPRCCVVSSVFALCCAAKWDCRSEQPDSVLLVRSVIYFFEFNKLDKSTSARVGRTMNMNVLSHSHVILSRHMSIRRQLSHINTDTINKPTKQHLTQVITH
jgi:hypothetical protein